MRIMHVIANLAPRYGGPPKACIEMAAAMAARGHQVRIFTTDQDRANWPHVPYERLASINGVRIYYFPLTVAGVWPISLPLALALARSVANYDLVHIHSLYLFHGAVACFLCRWKGVPYLIRPHGSLDPFIFNRHRFRKRIYEWLIERHNIQGAAALHFTTEEEKRLARPYLPHSRSIVVPLGLNMTDYAPLPPPGTFRQQFPKIGNARIILHLGRINFKKGLDVLVDAFARIAAEDQDVHLVIAGPDNDGFCSKVMEWVSAFGIGNKVTFTGMLHGEDKLAAFRDADVFALPSYSENFGIAVIEAMACELPVVISNRVNLWREVERAGAGIVTSLSPQEVSQAIERLLGNLDLRLQMGAAGRYLVEQRFQWGKIAQELEDAYRRIVKHEVARWSRMK